MAGLIRGELKLTIDIILGLLLGEMIIRFRVADTLLKHILPFLVRHDIPKVTGLALCASIGSSRAGAAIISSALANHELTEREAIWSILMLPFPAYLRRWPSTMIMSMSLAGLAGGIFALSLLLRSGLRFLLALFILKRKHLSKNTINIPVNTSTQATSFIKRIVKTLPAAWIFFAVSYSLVPMVNSYFRAKFTGSVLPFSGCGIAAASLGHISSALALAGGALASRELTVGETVFALILGSGLGTTTRILRQDAGYYFGLFTVKTARKLLFLNFITITPIIIMNLFLAWFALSF